MVVSLEPQRTGRRRPRADRFPALAAEVYKATQAAPASPLQRLDQQEQRGIVKRRVVGVAAVWVDQVAADHLVGGVERVGHCCVVPSLCASGHDHSNATLVKW